jgi:hypothetical protein
MQAFYMEHGKKLALEIFNQPKKYPGGKKCF